MLDEIFSRVVGCKFGVPSFDDFSPPVQSEGLAILELGLSTILAINPATIRLYLDLLSTRENRASAT